MREFTSLLNAVKPRERTDQYRILSALYCLGADNKPITVKSVNQLLKLHLSVADLPSNVSASLKHYSALVSPVDAGPPRLWLLTDAGIVRLRSMSGLALKKSNVSSNFEYDIGVICALEDPEFTAVIEALGGRSSWKEIGDVRYSHLYRESSLQSSDGKTLKVVGTTSTSMGLTAAAIATTQLINLFKPRIVVMVGIAAGTKSGGKQFGDILVTDPSVDYNSGKVILEDGVRDFLPDPYPIGLNPRLRSLLLRYRRGDPLLEKIRLEWRGLSPSSRLAIYLGPLGAADQVIDDETRILEIQKNWRKLIGIEMETYGVYRACHEAPEPKPRFVSMKAVCDFAAQKTDSWQSYAAYVAASFAFGFLEAQWSSLWPPDSDKEDIK